MQLYDLNQPADRKADEIDKRGQRMLALMALAAATCSILTLLLSS